MPIIIPLHALPRMQPSDKINRQALIQREDDVNAWLQDLSSTSAISLYTKKVREIWRDIFQRQAIPDDVEFLFLGGTSINAMEMVRQIQTMLDPTYSYQILLKLNTITVQTVAQSVSSKECFDGEKALIKLLRIEKNPENKTPLFFLPALLGEGGHFSYKELAESMSLHISQLMYGLSDPGILNEAWLPKSMDHAVSRYVAAIRTIQPKGPYELLGFSFGSTLVYEVAKRLLTEGERAKKIHLIDSFPPMIYQALNEKDRANLLQALLNFLLPVFNNRFYAENLLPEHAQSGFLHLKKQLKNPQSHQLLAIAKRHLEFMEQADIPEDPLAFSAIIYFTKRDQIYLNVINQIGISKLSADYRFYGWNRYFSHVRRSGIELDCEHLGVLKAKHNPQKYWERHRNAFFNVSHDFDGPETSYHWQFQCGLWKLGIYFLSLDQAQALERYLCSKQLAPMLYLHEKKLTKHQEKNYLIHNIATLICMVPDQLKEDVTTWVEELGYNRLPESTQPQTIALNQKRAKIPHAIDLHLLCGSSIYMTLTFHIDIAPDQVIQALHQQLHYRAKPETVEQHLQYFIPLRLENSVIEAVNNIGQNIANFISVIQPALQTYSAQKQSYPRRLELGQKLHLSSSFFVPISRAQKLELPIAKRWSNRENIEASRYRFHGLPEVLAISAVNKRLHADLNNVHIGELTLFKATL